MTADRLRRRSRPASLWLAAASAELVWAITAGRAVGVLT